MRKHKTISLMTRNKIVEFSESIKLANPNNVPLPSIDIAPIEGLEIFSGWRCQETSVSNESEKCRECCTSKESMKKHYREDHE